MARSNSPWLKSNMASSYCSWSVIPAPKIERNLDEGERMCRLRFYACYEVAGDDPNRGDCDRRRIPKRNSQGRGFLSNCRLASESQERGTIQSRRCEHVCGAVARTD